MDRRTFIRATGAAGLGGVVSIAGCLGSSSSSSSPPPRKSNVVPDVELAEGGLVVDVAADANRWVASRRDVEVQQSPQTGSTVGTESGSVAGSQTGASLVGSLSTVAPVGTASAQKGGGGGRGATGRGAGGYSSAPRTGNHRAWFHAHDDADDWYDEHSDETTRVPVDVATIGVAYLGSNAAFRARSPGPGDVLWDETFDDPGSEVDADLGDVQAGWYRVGAELVTDDDSVAGGTRNLGWESVDLRVERSGGTSRITERWKVSPQI